MIEVCSMYATMKVERATNYKCHLASLAYAGTQKAVIYAAHKKIHTQEVKQAFSTSEALSAEHRTEATIPPIAKLGSMA